MKRFRIDVRTDKGGGEHHYMVSGGVRYPIVRYGRDESGRPMISVPTHYLDSKMEREWGTDAEGFRQMIEKMSKVGIIGFAEEGSETHGETAFIVSINENEE